MRSQVATPLLQKMMYAIIQWKPEQLQFDVVKFFIDNNAVLSHMFLLTMDLLFLVLEMAISLTCFNIALKLIFEHHIIDPIYVEIQL